MTLLTAFARAEAAAAGRARLIRTVRHVHLGRRPLVVIPLQLAGEACAPLSVMLGDDRDKPRTLTVYEPRDRARRFEFAADLAEVILGHLDGYLPADNPDNPDDDPEPLPDAPQLLVPNPNAAAFLALLGRSTRLRRTDGEYAVRPAVPLLGRWLTHYAERAEVPGSALLLPMTTALAEHWATGQSDLEDANLAALLGWIDPADGLTGQQAARLAEDPVRCPPAGPVSDPTFDNEVLEGRMAAVRDATQAGDGPALARAQAAMDVALHSQLAPTWDLIWRAHALLAKLPEAAHAERRWKDDRRSFTAQAAWLREGGAPQPRRDSAVAAAKRLARLEREQQRLAVERAHDDPLVMAEYRLTGEAFAGTVVDADLARLDTGGKKAKLRPWLTVRTADAIVVEPGATLTCPDYPSQAARVIDITTDHDRPGETRVTLELSGGMGRALTAPPGTTPARGDNVTYTTLRDDFQPAPQFPSREETPWTHGGPPLEYVPTDDDAQEPWS
ncbi:MAG TPA: hypothetical protein VH021_26300 [Trebonia sp.]|nr:hypothetical protein [Trebonia sp.]